MWPLGVGNVDLPAAAGHLLQTLNDCEGPPEGCIGSLPVWGASIRSLAAWKHEGTGNTGSILLSITVYSSLIRIGMYYHILIKST